MDSRGEQDKTTEYKEEPSINPPVWSYRHVLAQWGDVSVVVGVFGSGGSWSGVHTNPSQAGNRGVIQGLVRLPAGRGVGEYVICRMDFANGILR